MRKFLFFDLGETLVDFNMTSLWRDQMRMEIIPMMYTNLEQHFKSYLDLPSRTTFTEAAYASIVKSGHPMSMKKRITEYLTTFQIPRTEEILQSQLDPFALLFAKKAKLYPGVKEILEELKNQEYTLGLWSNTPWQSPGYMSEQVMLRFDIRKYFSSVHFSGDYEIRKPAARALEIVQQASTFQKHDMIYIGNAEVDIKTGTNFGIPTVWIKENGDILSEDCPAPTYELNSIRELPSILPIKS